LVDSALKTKFVDSKLKATHFAKQNDDFKLP